VSLSLKKGYKNYVWCFIVFLALFVLSLDFWGWNSASPMFLGLPIWVYYLLFLTLSLSVFFYIIAKNVWRDEQ